MAPTSTLPVDHNTILIQLCIKVLKTIAPNGMTTKELAAALDKEVDSPGFNGITSSILSSKLNAVFRRSHNDSSNPTKEQLSDLPITRSQSTDVPRRLVYKYTPPSISAPMSGSITPKRRMSGLSDGSESPLSGDDNQAEPLTPKDEPSIWTDAKRRKSNTVTLMSSKMTVPQTKFTDCSAEIVSHRPQTPPHTVIKRAESQRAPTVNLYYDVVGYDAMAAVFANRDVSSTTSEELNGDVWIEEVSSPENLELNELDQMVC